MLPPDKESHNPIQPTTPHPAVAVGNVASASDTTEPDVPEAVAKEDATLA